ncbi:phospholipid carrier-dependent glycosyltransferase [Panacibacter sp. DH6]|uniref:Phospholipid carrier-dependent glycosyltransferase n=1 Tax=Panacibacter microcysteis TaxID=2793269 RepID=A0A931MCN1_9BACT|nr:phospholipid carrier-dependent glycosyltransferase [Panacibacter microcysteis]MBG9378157.1 phospholipid carrier-dependent glycosyltransferase [Panacibacter microcysteis]
MKAVTEKNKPYWIFVCITLTYIFFSWITFRGFNGTDDLHYAMLASELLKGRYNPFNENDIFSGRILLISYQALIYYIGGVNIITSQLGTMLATILCAYLTVFKLISKSSNNRVICAAALFYFNPVLPASDLTIMPDVYVMLAGLLVILLWKKTLDKSRESGKIIPFFLIGLIIFMALFFKENALVYLPFILLIAVLERKDYGLKPAFIITASFILLVFISGLLYYHYTNNFFSG